MMRLTWRRGERNEKDEKHFFLHLGLGAVAMIALSEEGMPYGKTVEKMRLKKMHE